MTRLFRPAARTAVSLALGAAALTLAPQAARACDFCMPIAGANPIGWTDQVALYSHELYLGGYRSGWSSAGTPAGVAPERDNHLTSELTLSTGIGDRWVLAATILFPYQHMTASDATGATTVSSFGIGDTYFMPGLLLDSSMNAHVLLSAVVKAPTGQTNVVDNHGQTADPDFQLGSGSWDLGGQLMAQLRVGPGQLMEVAMAKWDSTGRFLGAGPGGAPLEHSYSWDAMQDLIYSQRIAGDQAGSALLLGELGLDVGAFGHESYDGVPNPDAGGTVYVLAAPGLEVVLPPRRLVLEAVFQLPVIQYWSGTQLGYTFEAFVGARYLYDTSCACR